MTRRIALAILLTVWAMLIAGCATAYLTMRWVLVDQLDKSIEAKASSLPELARLGAIGADDENPAAARVASAPAGANSPPDADRYVIKNAADQTISPATGGVFVTNRTVQSARFATLADGRRVRAMTLRLELPGVSGPVTVNYQTSAVPLDQLLDRLAFSFTLFGLAAGLVAALVATRVSRAALRPLHATADVIGSIDPQNLHRRIDGSQLPPELAPMASRLNEMLERIEAAYVQRHQFLADASHELRTPVAALVTTAEVSLRHVRSAESYRATLESCLADARLLRRLVERLMEQCRADTLSHDEKPEEVELAPLLNLCADQAAALGREREVTVTREVPPADFRLKTQPGRLRSVVINLLSNAVEYNRPGGKVELRAIPNGKFLKLSVRDTGCGVAAEHLPHLFEPFYRADRARSGEAGHLGLGLSLVQSHVQALGGRIQVASVLGEGTTFDVELPLNGSGGGG
jgi:signal transduction histidine kinase